MAELSLIGFGEARLLKIGSSDAAATTDLALQHGGHVASVTGLLLQALLEPRRVRARPHPLFPALPTLRTSDQYR